MNTNLGEIEHVSPSLLKTWLVNSGYILPCSRRHSDMYSLNDGCHSLLEFEFESSQAFRAATFFSFFCFLRKRRHFKVSHPWPETVSAMYEGSMNGLTKRYQNVLVVTDCWKRKSEIDLRKLGWLYLKVDQPLL